MSQPAISVNVYGRGDRSKNDGPSHMGIALHMTGSDTCRVHHIRCTDDEHFFYDPRPFPIEGPVLWGRCIIAEVSQTQYTRAEELLTVYGNDSANIPEMGVGNCQDWVAGAMGTLEKAEIVPEGEGAFWNGQISMSGDQMGKSCKKTGRRWVEGERKVVDPADIDARFSDVEKVEVGKLADNPAFKNLLGGLSALNGSGKGKGLLVSSPFFSKTGTSDSAS